MISSKHSNGAFRSLIRAIVGAYKMVGKTGMRNDVMTFSQLTNITCMRNGLVACLNFTTFPSTTSADWKD